MLPIPLLRYLDPRPRSTLVFDWCLTFPMPLRQRCHYPPLMPQLLGSFFHMVVWWLPCPNLGYYHGAFEKCTVWHTLQDLSYHSLSVCWSILFPLSASICSTLPFCPDSVLILLNCMGLSWFVLASNHYQESSVVLLAFLELSWVCLFFWWVLWQW